MKNEQNENLTKQINKNELKQAIYQMKNGKSPGIDGIPVEYYITFYETLENDLIQLYNNILFSEKSITNTMKQAIITLILKKEDLNKLKYWRPISLLCIDYTILTKILANGLKNALPHIISKEQTCSIPNRTIFNNLFQIRDIIMLTKEKNNKLYILQVDQEEAFDKIDHDFLYKIINKMGFSNEFIQFVKILYRNNISYVINNEYLSSPIKLLRGLRQGCPLSLPLYVIHGEVTTVNINNNENIKGVKIPNNKK